MSISPSLQEMLVKADFFQAAIERLLEKYQIQPIGNGYIDLILDQEKAIQLIGELTGLPVAVERVTWWCHTTPETRLKYGCPHGYGGPQSKFGEGMYSECTQYPDYIVEEHLNLPDEFSVQPKNFSQEINNQVINYLKNDLPFEKFYSPCLCVGLWLLVPTAWKRKFYLI